MSQSADVAKKRLDLAVMHRADQLAAGSQFTLGIEFPMRSERDFQMMNVARNSAPIAFSDVRRYGHRRLAHLMGQSKPFALWEGFGDGVNEIGEASPSATQSGHDSFGF